MQTVVYTIERVLQALWVGALCGVGYLAVPTLFHLLDDRRLAGELAGQMFSHLNTVGFVIGGLLVLIALFSGEVAKKRSKIVLLCLMVLIVTVSATVLQPMMQELKAAGLIPGSEEAAAFGKLHGVSSILYLLLTVCGVALIAVTGASRQVRGYFG